MSVRFIASPQIKKICPIKGRLPRAEDNSIAACGFARHYFSNTTLPPTMVSTTSVLAM